MKRIDPHDLTDLDAAARACGIDLRCDLIYAQAAHPLNSTFCEAIYRPDARLWLHRDLAAITLLAATRAAAHGIRFVVTDGLRTVDAQTRMLHTAIVRANPHWTRPGPDMLLSQPGGGGHPRGMAVDIYLERMDDGRVIDMGTPLDYFSTDPRHNPAARAYPCPPAVLANRALLTGLMLRAARDLGHALVPLASEWWDFRFPSDVINAHAPLHDADLPPDMRMCG